MSRSVMVLLLAALVAVLATVGVGAGADYLYFDDFNDPLTWDTSDSSVYIKNDDYLYIGTDGGYVDWAEYDINLELTSDQIAIEQRQKLESGGLNYRLPCEAFCFEDGEEFGITYLGTDEAHPDPTHGWLFGSWTGSHEHAVPGTGWWTSATANYWAVTKIILNSTEAELFVKPDDLERGWYSDEYYKVAQADWSHSTITTIRFRQPWDSVCYIDYIKIYGLEVQPPLLTITSPAPNTTTHTQTITVTGTASDPSGIASVTVNGALASGAVDWSTWSKDVTLDVGENTI